MGKVELEMMERRNAGSEARDRELRCTGEAFRRSCNVGGWRRIQLAYRFPGRLLDI